MFVTRDYNLRRTPKFWELAVKLNAIVLTADTDFGELIALSGLQKPSVLFLTGVFPAEPISLALLIANVCNGRDVELENGAIIAIEKTRIHIRSLPISTG